jgi:predicted GNAT family N-acyltransferase
VEKHHMPQAKTYVVLGKNLSVEDLQLINKHRHKEFQSKTVIAPSPNNDDWEKPYFLVKQNEQLTAFGRLHNIRVSFAGNEYQILGIATIVAIEKGHGHGRQLMNGMKEFVQETKKRCWFL